MYILPVTMTNISMSVQWVEQLLRKVSGNAKKIAIKKFLNAVLIEISNKITEPGWAPVDTWILRKRSWYTQSINGNVGKLQAKIIYAIYVHEWTGIYARTWWRKTPWVYRDSRWRFRRTKWQRANPYMERSAKITEPKLAWMLKKYVDEVLSYK